MVARPGAGADRSAGDGRAGGHGGGGSDDSDDGGPNYAACFVACEREDGDFDFATSYDRDLVVESAMLIMARLAPLQARR